MEANQSLALQVLMLDADRNPIKNQDYKICFSGCVIQGRTGNDGMTKKVFAKTATDEVQIAIVRSDKSLKIIAQVLFGCGSKLVTLVSPKIKVEGTTQLHPMPISEILPLKTQKTTPVYDPKQSQPPTSKKELGAKAEVMKTMDGRPLIKVSGDIPNLEFLGECNGEVMAEADFVWAAQELGVEVAAIKAIAEVESKSAGFIKIGQRTFPKILYERHKFAKFTQNQYSKSYPDISLPCGYYQLDGRYVLAEAEYKKDRGVPDDISYYRPINRKDNEDTAREAVSFRTLLAERKLAAEDHKYIDGLGSYKRLIKAYQLAPEAALKSCSWGAFQIMGEYWSEMKYSSIQEFTRAVSRSEKEQLKSFVMYVKHVSPKVRNLIKVLDWEGIANAFNGPSYRLNKYDRKLEEAYEKFRGDNG